ncbi:MAG: MFS transporter [Steroidobacteraceae bacterium]
MLCSLLSYIDRQALAVLSPVIMSETHLNIQQYTEVVSCFSVAYMIGSPLWGVIIDRIGVMTGMTVAVLIWTAASGSHAALTGFLGFAAARALLGFGEGATFPGALRTAVDVLPANKQSRGIAIGYSGGSLGAVVAPLLVTPVAVAFGWRAAFLATGGLGVAWVLLWRTTVLVPVRPAAAWALPNFLERRFWAVVASYALGGLPLALILYLAPLYLSRVFHFSQQDLGRILWVPPLGWETGYFFWGWYMDRYHPGRPRPVRVFAFLAVMSLAAGAIPLLTSPWMVLLLMFWTMFIAGGFVVVSLRTGAMLYRPEQSALVGGIGAGSWSAAVALILPVLGRLFDQAAYGRAFVTVSLFPLAGTIFWWFLTAERREAGAQTTRAADLPAPPVDQR